MEREEEKKGEEDTGKVRSSFFFLARVILYLFVWYFFVLFRASLRKSPTHPTVIYPRLQFFFLGSFGLLLVFLFLLFFFLSLEFVFLSLANLLPTWEAKGRIIGRKEEE